MQTRASPSGWSSKTRATIFLEAADGETGVECAISSRPHLALVDIGLPGIDGFEVATRIRAVDPPFGSSHLTGYGRDDDSRLPAQPASTRTSSSR